MPICDEDFLAWSYAAERWEGLVDPFWGYEKSPVDERSYDDLLAERIDALNARLEAEDENGEDALKSKNHCKSKGKLPKHTYTLEMCPKTPVERKIQRIHQDERKRNKISYHNASYKL